MSRTIDDPLTLVDCRITNSVKCLPPQNKPTPVEMRTCNGYLVADLAMLPAGGAILALGRVAHDAALLALGARRSDHPFAHGARHALANGAALFDSYHCSRYNTNTGRLTSEMFRFVFDLIDAPSLVLAPARPATAPATHDIRIEGLMTMPPLAASPEASRPHFAALRELAARLTERWAPQHGFARLSMGTSQDYAVAVEEGATIVRLGSTLYRRSSV